MTDFHSTKTCKARKVHPCECCGRRIEIGEKYVRETGSFEGDFGSVAVCFACSSLIQTLWQNDENEYFRDNGIEYRRAWEYASEMELVCWVGTKKQQAA